MEIRVLGCSGGIGDGRSTTSFLVDGEVLVDAGSGVNRLSLDEMLQIRHIFLSHCHLDHVHAIPLLIDSVFDKLRDPIVVHALPETIAALREHMFNWVMWPDFTTLPSPEHPALRFQEMQPGETVQIENNRFEMVPVNHIVPTVAYIVSGGDRVCAFSGDTTTNDTFWDGLNRYTRLDVLIVETAFPNRNSELCRAAKHYCPQMLADDLLKLRHDPPIYLSHAKPGEEQTIEKECGELIKDRQVQLLSGDEVFTL